MARGCVFGDSEARGDAAHADGGGGPSSAVWVSGQGEVFQAAQASGPSRRRQCALSAWTTKTFVSFASITAAPLRGHPGHRCRRQPARGAFAGTGRCGTRGG